MKKILFFLIVFNCAFSQYKSGNIQYQLAIGDDDKLASDQTFKEFLDNAKIGAKTISFTLLFNNNASLFFKNDALENEYTDYALSMSVATNSYYTTKDSQSKIKQVDNYSGKFCVIYNDSTKWTLTNETKIIDNYVCYKATSEDIVINKTKTFKHPIIAWYCPEIPFNFGPRGYSNLPGMILELQVRHITWGASKIELKTDDIKIEAPKNGKIVNEEEYTKLSTRSGF